MMAKNTGWFHGISKIFFCRVFGLQLLGQDGSSLRWASLCDAALVDET